MRRSIAAVLLAGLCAACQAEEATEIRAVYISEGVPAQPDDAAWNRASVFNVPLMAQLVLPPHGGGAVKEVAVRALHDGEQLALRFEWADPSESRVVSVNGFRDAVAIGFPTRESELLPSPFMGDAEHPVNIWQWTADFDANAHGRGGFGKEYPHTEGVWYFPQDYAVSREVLAWRGTEPVIELVATGFGTLERKASQNVRGLGTHAKGRWRVVLRRALSTGSPHDTLFQPGGKTHVILAVWEGGNGEVNGKKSVTIMWTPVLLDSTLRAGR